jgi:hypothetical protein
VQKTAMNQLLIKRLSEHAKIPTVDALTGGFALFSAHEYVVGAYQHVVIQTDLAIDMPTRHHYGRIGKVCLTICTQSLD